jgi:hypothetical protein
MRIPVSLACSAAMVALVASGATAQGKGSPKPKAASGATAQGSHAGTAPAKTTVTSSPSGTTTSEPKAHASAPTKTSPKEHGKPTSTAAGTTTTTPTTGATGTTLTPVQQKLQQNTNLASKLQSRLPAGTDLNTAAGDFRNLGQFVAAVNVSNNLGLDFQALKTAMTKDGKSLGQAIQAQKTTVDGATVAARAEQDADAEIRSTEKSPKTPKTKSKSDGGRP